jgi:hypothetical protein
VVQRVFEIQTLHSYVCHKHHLPPTAAATTIDEAARTLLGLHSARLSSPFVILHARVPGFRAPHLPRAILHHREFIKLRCMRRTLYTVPLDLAPVVHQATLSYRNADCLRTYVRLGASERTVCSLEDAVISVVSEGPASSRLIEERTFKLAANLGPNGTSPLLLIRAAIKRLWESGVLCYLNLSTRWESEARRYGLTTAIYPTLDLESTDPTAARRTLVLKHIDRYGPVSAADIAWWSGLSVRSIHAAICSAGAEVTAIAVQGYSDPFYMTVSDLESFHGFRRRDGEWIKLLAHEDSSLKGYNQSRARYVAPQHYHLLFNRIGEARASIMLNGQVVGTWLWEKQHQKLRWSMFEVIPSHMRGELDHAAGETAEFLGNGPVDLVG